MQRWRRRVMASYRALAVVAILCIAGVVVVLAVNGYGSATAWMRIGVACAAVGTAVLVLDQGVPRFRLPGWVRGSAACLIAVGIVMVAPVAALGVAVLVAAWRWLSPRLERLSVSNAVVALPTCICAPLIGLWAAGELPWQAGIVVVQSAVLFMFGFGWLVVEFRRLRARIVGGARPTERDVALVLLALYVVAAVGAGVAASASTHVSYGLAARQVVWGYLDAVPLVKIGDFWAPPIAPNTYEGVQLVLGAIRIMSLAWIISTAYVIARALWRDTSRSVERTASGNDQLTLELEPELTAEDKR